MWAPDAGDAPPSAISPGKRSPTTDAPGWTRMTTTPTKPSVHPQAEQAALPQMMRGRAASTNCGLRLHHWLPAIPPLPFRRGEGRGEGFAQSWNRACSSRGSGINAVHLFKWRIHRDRTPVVNDRSRSRGGKHPRFTRKANKTPRLKSVCICGSRLLPAITTPGSAVREIFKSRVIGVRISCSTRVKGQEH